MSARGETGYMLRRAIQSAMKAISYDILANVSNNLHVMCTAQNYNYTFHLRKYSIHIVHTVLMVCFCLSLPFFFNINNRYVPVLKCDEYLYCKSIIIYTLIF